jgi:hypothetical protein
VAIVVLVIEAAAHRLDEWDPLARNPLRPDYLLEVRGYLDPALLPIGD